MKEVLEKFLQDVAQGMFGNSKLTYKEISEFMQIADKNDLEQLKEFYWDWSSQLTDEGEVDIEELEEFIYSVINNQATDSLQEGTWSLPKNKNEIKSAEELLDKLKKIKDQLYDVLGDDELFDNLDSALKRGNELIDNINKNFNIINEATGSEFGLTQITKFKDNPLITEILAIIKKKFKDLEVINIDGSGDIWHLDLRFEVEEPSQQNQFTREKAKEQAYKIKYELEKEILTKFNIPSFAIRGVRTVKGKDNMYCEFVISLVYANKGNIRVNYESKQQKIQSVLKNLNKEINKNK
jgi:hypothetical protein